MIGETAKRPTVEIEMVYAVRHEGPTEFYVSEATVEKRSEDRVEITYHGAGSAFNHRRVFRGEDIAEYLHATPAAAIEAAKRDVRVHLARSQSVVSYHIADLIALGKLLANVQGPEASA